MPFHITCACGRLTVVPDDAAGQTLRCPNCNLELEVPRVDAPLPPPAPYAPEVTEEPLVVVTADTLPMRRTRDPHLQTVQMLAVGVGGLALLSVIPIALALGQPPADQPENLLGGRTLQPWALATLLVAILHVTYILYLLQLPDYSCVRVVSLFLLLVSTGYAVVLGIRLLASNGNRIMEGLGLEGNLFSSSQEASWCFLMMTLTGVLSYLAGRAATRWQRQNLA